MRKSLFFLCVLLITAETFNHAEQDNQKQIEQTKYQLTILQSAIVTYMIDNDIYPAANNMDNLMEILAKRKYIQNPNIIDSWGKKIIYESNGFRYLLKSLGPDNKISEDDIIISRELNPMYLPKKEIILDQPNNLQERIPSETTQDVKELILKLSSPNLKERADSARKLGLLGNKSIPAIPFLIETLNVPDIEQLPPYGFPDEEAALALTRIGNPSIKALISALRIKHNNVRKWAAVALGDIVKYHFLENESIPQTDLKYNQVAESLIISLHDSSSDVRSVAAEALGNFKYSRASIYLIESLKDEDFEVRFYAASSLGDLESKEAIEPLIDALNDKNADVSQQVASALWKITGQTFGPNQSRWVEWWSKNKSKFSSSLR